MWKKLFILILACCISATACSAQKESGPDTATITSADMSNADAAKITSADTSNVDASDTDMENTASSGTQKASAEAADAAATIGSPEAAASAATSGSPEAAASAATSGSPEAAASAATIASPEAARDAQTIPDIEAGIYNINKYGNITLSILADSMKELGYEPADIISVRIGDSEMQMPIGTAYSDVDSGEPVCCYKTTGDLDVIVLTINSGNMAETLGVAQYHAIDEDPGYEWVYLNGFDENTAVRISMVQKQGYADEYKMLQLGKTRTNNRDDYASLTDAEYANFRVIETTGMGTGILYRSSSPINPALNRNEEADKALLDAQIRTVLNMADNESRMKQYADYSLTNYADCDIIALDMAMDLYSEDFRQKLAEGLRFIISHDGPYLIHCTEGKDRTGFAAAILECLMGADAQEVASDYMLSFYNYNGVEPGTEQYQQIAADNIEAYLAKAFGISSIRDENTDLQACAQAYLQDIGMNADEITALKDRLGQE